MKAVILAGGAGTRLRPITYEIPKPLVPVKKKPILNHLIEFFNRHGITDIAVVASRMHEEDFRRWQKAWAGEIPGVHEVFYEDKPEGTFGYLRKLKKWLGNDSFIVTNGDELKDFDLPALMEFHLNKGSIATLATVPVDDPHAYGVPIVEDGWVTEFLEKPENPPSNFINSGLYVFKPEVFDIPDAAQEFVMSEKDIFPVLAARGALAAMRMDPARWYDCGNLERWEKAMQEW
jgi:NDP-sugar pyrophosphorylase family protein